MSSILHPSPAHLDAVDDAAVFQIGLFPSVVLQLSGTFSGTVSFETLSDGVNWRPAALVKLSDGGLVTTSLAVGQFALPNSGFLFVRARLSAWVSGRVTVSATSGRANPSVAGGAGGGGGGGPATITDGVDDTIVATVKHYTNSNPIATVLVDSTGTPIAGSAVSIADGGDVTEGALADAAVTGDNAGSLSAKQRGLSKLFADVWDSVNHWLKVSIQNSTLAVTESGTWTVQPGNTANTTAWKVDGSAVTQPVSAASLPLPSGASTEAGHLATIDTATAAGNVLAGAVTETAPATDIASSGLNGRLQRIAQRVSSLIAALGSPFQAGGSIGNTSFAATQATASSLKAQVVGAGTAGTADAGVVTIQGIASMTKVLVTPDSVALPANQSVNVAQVAGATTAVGSGVIGTGTQRVTLASDDPAVAVLGTTAGAKVITDANGTIQQYLRGLIYQFITAAASFMTPVPDTVNGWLVAMMTSADGSTALTNGAQAIKASAGKLGGWYIYNPNASATYVLIYNVAAASVTVGTTNPQLCLCIPATSAANLEFVMGIPFTNAGWSVAATTTGGGNTAPSTALEANFLYK